MPTLAQARSRQYTDPGTQLASDLGQTILALLTFLSEKEDRKLNRDMLRQQILNAAGQGKLTDAALERAPLETKQLEEGLTDVGIERSLKGLQESISTRVTARGAAAQQMEDRATQVKEALAGTLVPDMIVKKGGSIYGPAEKFQDEYNEHLPPEQKRRIRLKLLQAWLDEVDTYIKDEQTQLEAGNKELTSVHETLGRDPKAIEEEVRNLADRLLGAPFSGDLDSASIRADMAGLLIRKMDRGGISDALAGVATSLLGGEGGGELQSAWTEEGQAALERELAINEAGGLAEFAAKAAGQKKASPEFLKKVSEGKFKEGSKERALFDALAAGKLHGKDAEEAMQLLEKGEDAYHFTMATREKTRAIVGPGFDEATSRAYDPDSDMERGLFDTARTSAYRVGLRNLLKKAEGTALPTSPAGQPPGARAPLDLPPEGGGGADQLREMLLFGSPITPPPAEGAPPQSAAPLSPPRDRATAAGRLSPLERMFFGPLLSRMPEKTPLDLPPMETDYSGISSDLGGSDAAQTSAFLEGVTAGAQAAMAGVSGAPMGPVGGGAPMSIPGVTNPTPTPTAALRRLFQQVNPLQGMGPLSQQANPMELMLFGVPQSRGQ